MPIADLLGVRFDMQLLAKLTVSAAAILFVTWIFRYYNSRSRDQAQAKNGLLPPRSTQPSTETSSTCKTVLTPLKERGKEEYDGQNRSSHSSEDSGQGILQLQKADGMVKKKENKAFDDNVTNIEETFWLFSGVDCNIQEDEKEKNKELKDFVTKTEGSSSLSSGVERNIDVLTLSEDIGTSTDGNFLLSTGLDTKPEDTVTKTGESFWLFSGVESKIEVDKIEEKKDFEDLVTNTDGSSSLVSSIERNIRVSKKTEYNESNIEGTFWLFTGVEHNIEGDDKEENKKIQDFVDSTDETFSLSSCVKHDSEVNTKPRYTVDNIEETFWLFSAVERNKEADKKEKRKEIEDFVPYTDGSSSLPPDVVHNTEGNTDIEDSVTNTDRHSSIPSGVDFKGDVDKKEANKEIEKFVTNTDGCPTIPSGVKHGVKVNKNIEDFVTYTDECSSIPSGVEHHIEVDKKEEKKEIEDFVTNADVYASIPSGVERNIEVDKPEEEKETNDFVANKDGGSSLPSGVKHNIEVDKKEEKKETEDIVTETYGSSSLPSGVEHNTEVDKTGEKKESNGIVTNTDGGSSLPSGVERNIEVDKKEEKKETDDIVPKTYGSFSLPSAVEHDIEVDKKSKKLVVDAEISPLSSSGVEHNIKECKTTEDFLTSTEGNSAPSPILEHTMEDTCNKAERDVTKGTTGLTLLTPSSDVKAAISPTGRRSPCQVKKLDGGVEVGRELRQNIGHPGMCSSFQSKAEIKVENADLVIERPGVQSTAVRGKIYDYFVETTSQSVSDLSPTHSISPTYGPYETNTLSNVMDRPRTPSPLPSSLIIRDVGFSNDSDRVSQAPIMSETGRVLRHGLIRKDSYLAAAEESELQIPFPPPVTRSRSPAVTNQRSANSPESLKDIQELGLKSSEDPQVETLARAQFFHFPIENIGHSELESLTGKLDLGNCLDALMLAKKHGHNALQQAALRVMSDNYFQVLRDPNLYGRLKGGERDQIQRQRSRGRRCLMVADMDCPDWTRKPHQSTNSYTAKESCGLYYYDDYKDSWHFQCQIPHEILSTGCAMCTMNNYLFVAVGFQWTIPSKKVFCYNPITSIWSEICPMNEARPHCKLVALEEYVYAIGGECLSTVERYDPRTNRWTFVASLPNETFAVAHRATACNGELFVSGGTLKYTLLRYNPKTNVWRQSLIVGSKERTTEMVAVRSCLYRFDVNPYIGISVYRYHVVARLWYECCSKQIQHCPAFQCVAMDDVIYCISRQFTMRFLADEKSPSFVADDLQILTEAKGILFPFVLALPDKSNLQTSV